MLFFKGKGGKENHTNMNKNCPHQKDRSWKLLSESQINNRK